MAVVWTAARLSHALFALALPLVVGPVFDVSDSRAASPSHPGRSRSGWWTRSSGRPFTCGPTSGCRRCGTMGCSLSRYRVSREAFVHGMRHRMVKPTCCWGQLCTVQVHMSMAVCDPDQVWSSPPRSYRETILSPTGATRHIASPKSTGPADATLCQQVSPIQSLPPVSPRAVGRVAW